MRKTLALLISAGLAAGMLAAPAHGGGKKAKKKTIKDTVSMTAVPFPNLSSHTGTAEPGCTAGQEGVHKVTTPLHVPGKGKLTVDMADFTGDWDIYILDVTGVAIARSDSAQVPDGAPPVEHVEVPFKKPTDVAIVGCNWAGAPTAELSYKLVYIPAKGKHHNH